MPSFKDQTRIIFKWIVDFIEKNIEVEFQEMRDSICFNWGVSQENATKYVRICKNAKKIGYKKKGGKVFVYKLSS